MWLFHNTKDLFLFERAVYNQYALFCSVMSRFLTGIQSSGIPHLGNLLGAIVPAIQFSQKPANDSFLFVADLHSLTSLKDREKRIENTKAIVATWMSFGLDTEKVYLYRQSRIPEVCELMWYLSCISPFPMLANAHSFKEKSQKLSQVNAGLFTYPILMAADIILYDVDYVPVGRDQKQHIEMVRDLASSFNMHFGDTFKVPKAKIEENTMTILGTDGNKMSKSYGNTIDIFTPEKQLRKQIFSIATDSTPLEAPKNPAKDTVFSIYKLLATKAQADDMQKKYLAGNYGYGNAKQELYELILEKYNTERKAFDFYMKNPDEIYKKLMQGEQKARLVAGKVLDRVRKKLGYR